MTTPVIGLTLDTEAPGGYSEFPWYAIRQNYCAAVRAAGGLAVVLPHESVAVADYIGLIDGLIVTGGAFDVDPRLFGAAHTHETVTLKQGRTEFERAATEAALAEDMPVFGICGGQHLLNVVLGGTLIQHIPDQIGGALAHEQPNSRDQPGHEVEIVPGTLLHEIVGAATLQVNSAHHQAVAEIAPGVEVDARAPDGVIEGIEDRRYRFCLGVQWHPEFILSDGDERLFAAFVDACRG